MTSLMDSLRHPDEIEENDIYKRFALSYYQLGKLPARRLSKQDSRRCGSWRHKLTFYKVSCCSSAIRSQDTPLHHTNIPRRLPEMLQADVHIALLVRR